MRLALIGLGAVSKYYLAAIRQVPEVDLVAVCDLRGDAMASHGGRLPCYRDHARLLAEERLDGVVVTVPNDAHARVCRAAIDAGVAVCVEKPLARTLREARELQTLSNERGVPLFTAFHRRYNDNVRDLVDLVAGRSPVVAVTVRYLERIEEHIGGDAWYLDPQRCGGGCLADNGPNAFDLVRLFLGELTPSRVDITRDGHGIERGATIDLCSMGGAKARVELDWSYPGEVKDIEIRLADGTCHRADMLDGYPDFKGSLWHEYRGIVSDFVRSTRSGGRENVAGLAAQLLVDACYRHSIAAETAQ